MAPCLRLPAQPQALRGDLGPTRPPAGDHTGSLPLKILGLILLGMAAPFRPRLGSVKQIRKDYDEITRAEATTLFALVDRCAEAIGAPAPHHIVVSPEWSAFATTVGLRRRRS